MKVNEKNCTGCKDCFLICPLEAISFVDKKPRILEDLCTECGTCFKVCRFNAMEKEEGKSPGLDVLVCNTCPIHCQIKPGKMGACQRFIHREGRLERQIPLVPYERVKSFVSKQVDQAISQPLLTGIGAGTTAPCYKPSPYIVQDKVNGIDVITCVTECIFTFSSMEVKVDTDFYIGQEGAPVIYQGKEVGLVATGGYGYQKVSLGGPSIITEGTPRSQFTVRAITDLANRKAVKFRVKGGSSLLLQVGAPPIVNKKKAEKMRFGCGGATLNLLGRFFKGVADEVIVIDYAYTGLYSELPFVRRDLKIPPSGVELTYRRNTPGRYYGETGNGWGQSNVKDPRDLIRVIDPKTLKIGMTVLVTEPTGQQAKMFQHIGEGKFEEMELTAKAREAIQVLSTNVEESTVSALYIGGAGGSARGGVTRNPLKLTQAFKDRKANLTVGGASTFLLPGGGITFAVNVEDVLPGSFSWVPSPAVVAPIEYTMTLQDYLAIGGHQECIRPLKEVLEENQSKPFEVPKEGW